MRAHRKTAAAILSAAVLPVLMAEDRTFDGTGNNLANPLWGSDGTNYSREASGAHYADGISAPAGAGLPSARAISNTLFSQGENSVLDSRSLSAMVYTWGQFIDHDLDLRIDTSPAVPMNIAVPATDQLFDPTASGTQLIPVTRSGWDPATGTSAASPRQQINSITSYLDASMVYGSTAARANWLRAGSGGMMKVTATPTGALLPHNDGTQVVDGIFGPSTSTAQFVAGDTRVNEQIGITSIQTLLLREHNRQATLIARANPGWTDDQVYQRARKIVSGEIDAITYNEYLPAVLGGGKMPTYAGYNASVNPSISNAFAAVGFRFGHSQLDDDIERVGTDGLTIAKGNLGLRQAFFNPGVLSQPGTGGVDAVLRGFTTRVEQSVDLLMIDDIRNFLFGPPGAGGMDLAAIDIQRGRDHGLADYNTMRQDFGLAKVTTFAQISSDPAIQQQLQSVYGNVDNIDAFVGALAEDHLANSSVGPLISATLVDQFTRTRSGDRLFYLNDPSLSASDVSAINTMTLSELLHRNTFVRNIQDSAFTVGTINVGATWNQSAGASWASSANWSNAAAAPTGGGVFASFLANTASALIVPLDVPTVIGSVQLSNTSGVNITPGIAGSLAFDNLGSNAGLLVMAGTHSISAPVSLVDSLSVIYSGNGSVNLAGNIGETNLGRSITVDGSGVGLTGGGVTTIGGNNSYTGGVQVTQSQLNLNHVNAQGPLGALATAADNGEIVLGFTPSTGHRFQVADLGAIQGSSVQLAALSNGQNLALADGAMIVRQSAGGALPGNLGSTPIYYAGYTANNTGASAAITIGSTSNTPFRGIGAGRTAGYTWGSSSDTLMLAGNADVVSLGGSTLTVAAKMTGGLPADTLTKRGTGTVKLTNASNNFAASNIAVQSGALQYAYGQNTTFPANTTFNISPDAMLKFNDGFSTTLNGAIVNNGSIVKPSGTTTQLVFHGGALTGSGTLLAQDTQIGNGTTPTSTFLAHAMIFNNGKTNFVGNVGGLDPTSGSPIISVDGPNTVLHVTGDWKGDGPSQSSWMLLSNNGRLIFDAGASTDTIDDSGTKLRPFNARGDGTGTVEFADGFTANKRDEAPGVNELYVWSPGNFNWVSRSSSNFPDSNIEINQEDGGTWFVQTHDQVVQCGLTASRSFTINTQTNLTLARKVSWAVFDGSKSVTKTGPGVFTIAGENAVGTATRGLSASGSTLNVVGGQFVNMTDMGQVASAPGANGVFGPAGLPDADDVITTSYVWNLNLSNPTTTDFNSSQHLLSLKINSGATANLNRWVYGGNGPSTMTVKTLATDAGAGTLNVGTGNLATATSLFSVAASSTLNKVGTGTVSVVASLTFGNAAAVNVAAGTMALATAAGAVVSIGSAGNFMPPTVAVSSGATLMVNASGNDPFSDDTVSTRRASLMNNGQANLTAGSVNLASLDGTGAIQLATGAQLSADHVRQGSLDLQGTASASVRAGGGSAGLSTLNTLSLAGGSSPTAKLDLNDNHLILDYSMNSPIAAIRADVIAGRAGGLWNGKGIASTSASLVAADNTNLHKTALGCVEASNVGMTSLYGQPIDGTAVVVRYVFSGDANIDGTINALDFNALAANFGTPGTGAQWWQGDFDYSGTVGLADFTMLSSDFSLTLPGAPIGLGTLVPEPGTVWLMTTGFYILRRRHFRR